MTHEDYDIGAAFTAIENELINSMIRNMDRHRAEEEKEGIQWSQWQIEQLKALEKYKVDNKKKFGKKFKSINAIVERLIRMAKKEGSMEQEESILEAIKNGFKGYKKASSTMQAEFFKLNDRKLDALINATTDDLKKAEVAVLRMANDKYRKVIFNAQVYANSGAGTYEKAVDMATHDMLAAGLNCVQYANGARHTLADYADMALRTAGKRAYLQGEGQKRQEWGIATVIMNKRGNPCPKCLPWAGKVLIDDVWSGGKESDEKYPLMSYAVSQGLYHPRCRDSHTTYFPGITTADDTWTKKELENIGLKARGEAKQQYAKRQAEKYRRLAENSLDAENQKRYAAKERSWMDAAFRTGNVNRWNYEESDLLLADFHAVSQDKVVSILRQDSEGWIQKLSEEEKRALKKYTYNSGDKKPNRFYERLNAMLRGELPEEKRLKEYAETISGALNKNRLKQDIIAYRGMDIDPTNGAEAGSLFAPEQFFSSSVIDTRSFDAKYKFILFVKKGSKAAYIEKLSYFPAQRELLLDKDCIYRVISRNGNIIELEVI